MSSFLAHTARAVCVALIAASNAAAQTPADGAELTLAAAVERTLERNPTLASFMFRLRAQRARGDAATLRTPLELRVDVEDAFGTGRTSGLDTAEATVALAQVIELGDKRNYRVAAADAAASLIEVERAAAQLDVLAELARRFIHVAADQEQLRLTARATELAEETAAAAGARVAAARAPEVELRRANVTLARAQIEREHAEHELLSSRRKLAAMWGDVEPRFGEVAADLYSLPAADSFETLLANIEDNPDFARFASEARLRDAEIRVAEAQSRASIVVNAGVKHLRQSDDHALVFGFTMPLGSAKRRGKRNRRGLGAARRNRRRARGSQDQRAGAAFRDLPGAAARDHRSRNLACERDPRDGSCSRSDASGIRARPLQLSRMGRRAARARRGAACADHGCRKRAPVSHRDRTIDGQISVGHELTGVNMNRTIFALLIQALWLVGCGSDPRETVESAEQAEAEGAEEGPNGGRLLRDDDFTIELAIFESGVPPEFHAWAAAAGRPLNPREVDLTVELMRLGGETNRIEFAPTGDYLRSDQQVHEPHSFDVLVTATHGGRRHQWEYAAYEGRTMIASDVAASAGIETSVAAPGVIEESLLLYGVISPDVSRVREVKARFPGVIRSVSRQVGDAVRAGEPLATIESNESLQAYAVTAPIAGVITQRHAEPGEQADAADQLFVIADFSSVWAELSVFPRDRSLMNVGQRVALSAEGGAAATGTVSYLAPIGDRSSQSLTARVVLDNADGRWTPGQFVDGVVTIAEDAVELVVPLSALQTFREFDVVFARVGDTYEVRMVELGRRDAAHAEVLGGLAAGTVYVTENSYLVKADIEKAGASHDH